MPFIIVLFAIGCFSLGLVLSELALPRWRKPHVWMAVIALLFHVIMLGLPLYPQGESSLMFIPIFFGALVGFFWNRLSPLIAPRVSAALRPYLPYLLGALTLFMFIAMTAKPVFFQTIVFGGMLIALFAILWKRIIRPLIKR